MAMPPGRRTTELPRRSRLRGFARPLVERLDPVAPDAVDQLPDHLARDLERLLSGHTRRDARIVQRPHDDLVVERELSKRRVRSLAETEGWIMLASAYNPRA